MSKLDGINPGDRVRVTFEGEFLGHASIRFDGSSIGTHFQYSEFETPTFHIEKLAPPLKVGDRKRIRGAFSIPAGEVLAVFDESVWFKPNGREPMTLSIADLEPAQ